MRKEITMANIPVKVKKRFSDSLKKYKPILTRAEKQDLNESDTVTIIVDMLSDIFGYDKYTDITSEFAIKKTYCDLAIRIDGVVKILIEVKSIATNLRENHLKQATDYGSNAGIDWVVLTNGETWKVYKIIFGKPIEHELVYEFNMHDLKATNADDICYLFMLSKEAIGKKGDSLDEYHAQKKLLNPPMLAQIILHDDVINAIKRTLRKVSSDTKVSSDEIYQILVNYVLKRDALDDEKTPEYKRKIARATKKKVKA